MIKGIDLSTFQKDVDYKRLKDEGIEFAIIRCGYGKENSQKDDMFETHYKGLKEAGIKVGGYLYSYCSSVENAIKEAENCLYFIQGKEFDLPIFYDLEDKVTRKLGKEAITQIAINFCERIKKAGYKVGVYANLDWFTNYLKVYELINRGYKIWLAQWNVQNPTSYFPYNFWQYTNKMQVARLTCDGNYCKNEEILKDVTKQIVRKSNEEIADEVIAGKWGNGYERKVRLTQDRYNYIQIQEIVNQKLKNNRKSDEEIANEVIRGLWGNGQDRKNRLAKEGYNYQNVQKIVNQKLSK